MKKILLFTVFAFTFFINISIANAITDVNENTNGTDNDCTPEYCWPTYNLYRDNKALRAVRMTIYNSNGEVVSNSVDISNNNGLNGVSGANIAKKSKAAYLKRSSLIWTKDKIEYLTINILSDKDYCPNCTTSDNEVSLQQWVYYIRDNINNVDSIKNESIKRDINALIKSLNSCKDSYSNECNTDKYYAIFEPVSLVIYNYKYYYGTATELAKLDYGNYNNNHIYKLNSVINRKLPEMLYIKDDANILFYETIGLSKNYNKFGNYNFYNGKGEGRYNNSNIINYGLGIGVYDWTNSMGMAESKKCETAVSTSKCGETTIAEPNSEVCVVNNRYYKESEINGATIYCSSNITTDFSPLYNSINDQIFKSNRTTTLNGFSITDKKTCYIKNSNNGAKNWENSLNEKDNNNSNIVLNFGNNNIDFINKNTISSKKCESKDSNGVCKKATLNITHTYSYDSKAMISLNTWQPIILKKDEKSNNVIDASGTNIFISNIKTTGTYLYNMNLKSSILAKMSARLKKFNQQNVSFNNMRYNLSYTFDKSLTDNDLSYSCPYKAQSVKSQLSCKEDSTKGCECSCDENGCTTVIRKCDDSNKCCDCNGTEIPCPESNPVPPDDEEKEQDDPITRYLVYRPISLSNPFPGINGNGRKEGWNWSGNTNNGQSYIDYYITNNRGYKADDVYNATPLYVIDLSPNEIKEIKKYNDKHDYSDFALKCDNGNYCTSTFVHSDISGLTSGTCSDYTNISKEKFESCYQRGGK